MNVVFFNTFFINNILKNYKVKEIKNWEPFPNKNVYNFYGNILFKTITTYAFKL